MQYDAKSEWTNLYRWQTDMSYPAEGVIRILKGSFPGLLMPKPTAGKILDLVNWTPKTGQLDKVD